MPQYQLIVRRGPRAGETFELKSQTVIIGRDSTADIIINDPEVSRNHCRLILDRAYYLQDLGSTNGTFIDGQRLSGEPVRLANGQIIQLGSNVTLLHQEIVSPDSSSSTYVQSNEDAGLHVAQQEGSVVELVSTTPPERVDHLPSFEEILNAPDQGPALQTPPTFEPMPVDPEPAYTPPPTYSEPEPAYVPYPTYSAADSRGNTNFGEDNSMPWANWTQRQWLIVLAVVLLLLLCICCLFMAIIVFLLRPDLVGAEAILATPAGFFSNSLLFFI